MEKWKTRWQNIVVRKQVQFNINVETGTIHKILVLKRFKKGKCPFCFFRIFAERMQHICIWAQSVVLLTYNQILKATTLILSFQNRGFWKCNFEFDRTSIILKLFNSTAITALVFYFVTKFVSEWYKYQLSTHFSGFTI